MYFTQDKITEIFYITDEFCTKFQKSIQGHLLGKTAKKKTKMYTAKSSQFRLFFMECNIKT